MWCYFVCFNVVADVCTSFFCVPQQTLCNLALAARTSSSTDGEMKKKKAKPQSAVLQDISSDIKHIIASLFRKPQVDCAKRKLFVCFSFCRFLFVYLVFFFKNLQASERFGTGTSHAVSFLEWIVKWIHVSLWVRKADWKSNKEEPRCGFLNERWRSAS